MPSSSAAAAAWTVAPVERRARSTSCGDHGSPSASDSRRVSSPPSTRSIQSAVCVRSSSSRVAARAGSTRTPSSRFRALAHEAVLREREAVAGRERVLDDVVGERAHAPARYRQTRTVRRRATVRPAASRTTTPQHVPALRGARRPPRPPCRDRRVPRRTVAIVRRAVEEADRTDRASTSPRRRRARRGPDRLDAARPAPGRARSHVGRWTTRSRPLGDRRVRRHVRARGRDVLRLLEVRGRGGRAAAGRRAAIGACGGSGEDRDARDGVVCRRRRSATLP